ncbi:amino acid/amide ABC transporter membrane protein 2, HAAT family [Thermoanaerobacter thermohydrosulfuricus]|uniref:Inner-membrane translocator n=3 Tax=Thermoanaerobacter TaxID=1754 RepID=D3T7H9_THEIA|nr:MULTISPECIES: branched-chain amino acid ABC transporter permease [Thermoanaerobacter]ADD01911.1 inner-membrane translocator [Thermoanaerobacter italicus Ab9]EMT39913.1 ABC-type branched-chain amino acid transport system, permease component [Thermoanaerobacter thermohydrosulfuricus WC1]SDF61315.1 amino acid/amide ABC transporter membrane protein 2, HAAT family [Thermoanaerobacter thermohydrosulfuricus]SFE57763.1 amino acid/amide ABC transporter membrane protein 2, HAAT family [Thermoanaerobac
MLKNWFAKENLAVTLLLVVLMVGVQVLYSAEIISPFVMLNLITIAINIILAVSLNLVVGFTGQFSIGHAGFMALGAYASAIMSLNFNVPFIVSLLVGAIVAGIGGIIIGIPTLRLRGDYLAIATLGLAEIIRGVITNIDYLGGAYGLMGIPQKTNWLWAFGCMLVTVLVIKNFVQSSHGRACVSVRENEIASEAMGINTTKYKVIAFTMGSFFAGIGGALLAHYITFIEPNAFNFLKSFDILVMVVLGGQGSLTGSVVAAIVLTLISTFLQSLAELRLIIYAIILILVMLFRPQGLLGTHELSFKLLQRKRGVSHGSHSADA